MEGWDEPQRPSPPPSSSMDTTAVGEVAAQAMERLADEFGDDCVPAAIGIVVIGDAGDRTFTRLYANVTRYFEWVGMLETALEAVKSSDADDGE